MSCRRPGKPGDRRTSHDFFNAFHCVGMTNTRAYYDYGYAEALVLFNLSFYVQVVRA